ncbi:MAG: tetratricopeptide repeat protein [Bacteroidota bacterium]
MAKNNNYQNRKNYTKTANIEASSESVESKAAINNPVIDIVLKWQTLIVFLFGVMLYANTLSFDYTLDDRLMIFENKFTKEGVKGLGKIMSTDAFVGFFGENKNLLTGGRYRPLTHIMFALEWQIFGKNPFVGHLVNILLYGLLGIVILRLLKKLFSEYGNTNWYLSLPFVATILYLAHPIHTEVVANIKGRDEIVTSILSVMSIYVALLYVDKNKIQYLLLVFAVYFLALFSKENAITFLAIIPLTVYFFRDKKTSQTLFVLLPMFVALAIYFGLRFKFGLMKFDTKETELLNDPYISATVSERYATVFYTLWKYVQLLIFPHPLTHDYYPKQIAIINWGSLQAIFSFLVYLGIGLIGLRGLIKKNIWGWIVVFYLATLSISSNLFFNIGAFMNERFVFMSSLSFSVLIAYLLVKRPGVLGKLLADSKTVMIIILVILAGYSLKTFTRNYAWKDDFTLFTTDVLTSTNSAKVNVSAGGMLIEKAQKEENKEKKLEMLELAKTYLYKGTTIHPYYVAGWVLYGNAFLYADQYEQALLCYVNSLNIAPTYQDALTNLHYTAQTTYKKNMYDVSARCFKTLIKFLPNDLDKRFELATVLDDAGRYDTAMIVLNNILKVKPNYYQAYNRIGQIYGKRLNNIDQAIVFLEKANSINAKDASVWENLGVAYGFKGKFNESINAFLKAIEFNPKNSQTYFNLSNSYRFLGKKALAEEYIKKGQQVKVTETAEKK